MGKVKQYLILTRAVLKPCFSGPYLHKESFEDVVVMQHRVGSYAVQELLQRDLT